MKKLFLRLKENDNLLAFICCFAVAVVALSCLISSLFRLSSDVVEDQPSIPSSSSNNCFIWVDPDTGVNYVIYTNYCKAGMSVRYNSDGSVFVTPIE